MRAKPKKQKHLHEKRRVTFQELGVLLGVRSMLQAGLVNHTTHVYPDLTQEHGMNMLVACKRKGCASIGCIGGTMAMLMGMDEEHSKMYVGNAELGSGQHSKSLRCLFFPPLKSPIKDWNPRWGVDATWWKRITGPMMMAAIDNWVQTGKPDWNGVILRIHRATARNAAK